MVVARSHCSSLDKTRRTVEQKQSRPVESTNRHGACTSPPSQFARSDINVSSYRLGRQMAATKLWNFSSPILRVNCGTETALTAITRGFVYRASTIKARTNRELVMSLLEQLRTSEKGQTQPSLRRRHARRQRWRRSDSSATPTIAVPLWPASTTPLRAANCRRSMTTASRRPPARHWSTLTTLSLTTTISTKQATRPTRCREKESTKHRP